MDTPNSAWSYEKRPWDFCKKNGKVMIYRCDANGLLDNGNDWDNEPTGMTMELEQGRTLWNSHAAVKALKMTTDLCQLIIENNPMRAI